jgi:hypothetical protein
VRLSQVGRPPTFCTYEQEGDCEATDRIYKLNGVKDKKGRVSKMVDLSESAKTILRHFKCTKRTTKLLPLWDSYLMNLRSVSLPKPNW